MELGTNHGLGSIIITIGDSMSDEKYVKRYYPYSYCYEYNRFYRICNFPGRDGIDIGKGKSEDLAWKQAREYLSKK